MSSLFAVTLGCFCFTIGVEILILMTVFKYNERFCCPSYKTESDWACSPPVIELFSRLLSQSEIEGTVLCIISTISNVRIYANHSDYIKDVPVQKNMYSIY